MHRAPLLCGGAAAERAAARQLNAEDPHGQPDPHDLHQPPTGRMGFGVPSVIGGPEDPCRTGRCALPAPVFRRLRVTRCRRSAKPGGPRPTCPTSTKGRPSCATCRPQRNIHWLRGSHRLLKLIGAISQRRSLTACERRAEDSNSSSSMHAKVEPRLVGVMRASLSSL
jgi:hypothetical protein